MSAPRITVIGAGLAGCEAAWQAARLGVDVTLYEMKPYNRSAAHSSDSFAELVCSNSLRAAGLENAVGLLKQELRELGSLIMQSADANRVEAGGALAVDRKGFSEYITRQICSEDRITVVSGEVTGLPTEGIVVVATGPLTSHGLAEHIKRSMGAGTLHFYDAAAPIVEAESIDMAKAFYASRYNKGEASYINCPMTREEYEVFYNALISAETAKLHLEEENDPKVFEGCMPVEVMAKRGFDTLLYGPLKPVGLIDPRTGKQPFAVVQLRIDDSAKTLYNIVGFQTHLTFGEQKRVFGLIPGLENASFARYGVMHRNTYLDSPRLLSWDYSLRSDRRLYFAGQMTGVEGYIESTSSGWTAGYFAAMAALGREAQPLPRETAIGALAAYISDPGIMSFQPMNINFGLLPTLDRRVRGGKREKNLAISERALNALRNYLKTERNTAITEGIGI